MFSQACVCLRGGLPQCMLEYHLTGTDPPGADTPPEQTPPPGADTHPEQTPRADPPRETATAADGTHPTGIHSCFY